MAGRGPAPKKQADRRRTNDRQEQDLEVIESSAPKLPATYKAWDSEAGKVKAFRFLPRTKSWYLDMCESPELKATMTAASYFVLQDLAVLQDRWFRTGSLEIRKELRLGLAAFGATPADARRLGLQLKPKPTDKPKPTPSESSKFGGLRAV